MNDNNIGTPQKASLRRHFSDENLQPTLEAIETGKQSCQTSKSKPLFDNQLLTYKQAAELLSVSESYLRRLKSRGHMPFVHIGHRGIRFKVAALNSWVENREIR